MSVKITVIVLIKIAILRPLIARVLLSRSRSFLKIVCGEYKLSFSHWFNNNLSCALLPVVYRRINLPVDKRANRTMLNYDL